MTPNTLWISLLTSTLFTSTVTFSMPPSLYVSELKPPLKLSSDSGPPMFLERTQKGRRLVSFHIYKKTALWPMLSLCSEWYDLEIFPKQIRKDICSTWFYRWQNGDGNTIKLLLKFTEETRLQQLMTHVSIKQCVSYCRRVEAMLAVMVCAGILGRPDDWVGGNWVWLKEGNPGV